jgi:hypothetical protein
MVSGTVIALLLTFPTRQAKIRWLAAVTSRNVNFLILFRYALATNWSWGSKVIKHTWRKVPFFTDFSYCKQHRRKFQFQVKFRLFPFYLVRFYKILWIGQRTFISFLRLQIRAFKNTEEQISLCSIKCYFVKTNGPVDSNKIQFRTSILFVWSCFKSRTFYNWNNEVILFE